MSSWVVPNSIISSIPVLFNPSTVTTDTTLAINSAYIANGSGIILLTMPGTAAVGSIIKVTGLGAGLYDIMGVSGTIFHINQQVSITGVNAQLKSQTRYSSIELQCIVANAEWKCTVQEGGFWINDLTGVSTYDPAFKDSHITLSGANLIGDSTSNGGWGSTRTTGSKAQASHGLFYAEFSIATGAGTPTQCFTGIGTSTVSSGSYVGSDANSIGYYGANGNKYINAAATGYGSAYTAGDVVGVAVDLTNSYVYFAKNNTWQNSGDPTSGGSHTGGLALTTAQSYYLFSSWGNTGRPTITANFGASAFTYTAPANYLAWNTANVVANSISSDTLFGNYGGATPLANSIGEYLNTNVAVASGVALTTNTATQIAALTLTPGTWMVWALGVFNGITTGTVIQVGVNATTATFTTPGIDYTAQDITSHTPTDITCISPIQIFSITSSTTYYHNQLAVFTVGTVKGYGKIHGIRIA